MKLKFHTSDYFLSEKVEPIKLIAFLTCFFFYIKKNTLNEKEET